jgi:hypothetical protein
LPRIACSVSLTRAPRGAAVRQLEGESHRLVPGAGVPEILLVGLAEVLLAEPDQGA